MKTALIIISEAAMQNFLTKHLTSMGFKCQTAPTMADGLTILGHTRPDLIIVNDLLAGAPGSEVVKYAKSNGHRETPMITLSYEHQSQKEYKVAHLQRPIQVSKLRQCVEHLAKGN